MSERSTEEAQYWRGLKRAADDVRLGLECLRGTHAELFSEPTRRALDQAVNSFYAFCRGANEDLQRADGPVDMEFPHRPNSDT